MVVLGRRSRIHPTFAVIRFTRYGLRRLNPKGILLSELTVMLAVESLFIPTATC